MAEQRTSEQSVREACLRAELRPGDKVIDVGCGPLGALHVLDELVGPEGTVVGLDAKAEALSVARGVLQRRGLGHVTLVHGDINESLPSDVSIDGPFDAAYCRLLLCNQSDPATTLRRMASLLRPGGKIIAHELLDDPSYPHFDPPLTAATRLLELVYACMHRRGKRPGVAREFRTLVDDAGLRLVAMSGRLVADPAEARDFIQTNLVGLLLSFEGAFLAEGLVTHQEVAELARELQQATLVNYRTFYSWIFVELIAQVP